MLERIVIIENEEELEIAIEQLASSFRQHKGLKLNINSLNLRSAANDRVSAGGIVKAVREARGYTQDELANFSGYSKNSISNWERSRTQPNMTKVQDIVESLRFTMRQATELAHTLQEKLDNEKHKAVKKRA